MMTFPFERLQSPTLRATFCRRIVSKEMRSFVTSLDPCPFNPESLMNERRHTRRMIAEHEFMKESSQVILKQFI